MIGCPYMQGTWLHTSPYLSAHVLSLQALLMDEAGLDIASIRRLSRFELQLSDACAGLSQGYRNRESSSWLSAKLPIEEQRQCTGS